MKRTDKKKEERRLWASAMILSGMCANYAHSLPSAYRAYDAIELADYLLHFLETTTPPVFNNVKDKDKGSKTL